MKYLLLILLSFAMLFTFSCDRFAHNFSNNDSDQNIEVFFGEFETQLENITIADIAGVMDFYHNDYNNNGITKSDVENFYLDILQSSDPLDFQAEITEFNSNLEIIWNLRITDINTDVVIIDSLITDVLIPARDDYLFYGNQAALQKVLIELFTATWCPNCPYVENALHSLKEEYGSKLSYVEYHMFDIYDFGNFDIANYYGATAFPHTFINGSVNLEGGSEESLQIIEDIIQPILDETAELVLSALDFTVTRGDISGSVKIDTEIQNDNMILKFVITENHIQISVYRIISNSVSTSTVFYMNA